MAWYEPDMRWRQAKFGVWGGLFWVFGGRCAAFANKCKALFFANQNWQFRKLCPTKCLYFTAFPSKISLAEQEKPSQRNVSMKGYPRVHSM